MRNLDFDKRLRLIGKEIERLIKLYKPDMLAAEKLYFNSNQKTAMMVSEVRGAVIYIAARKGIKVAEYTPQRVKMAITGYGRGSKEQVISMVPRLIDVEKHIAHDDEFDAIAIGLTCLAIES